MVRDLGRVEVVPAGTSSVHDGGVVGGNLLFLGAKLGGLKVFWSVWSNDCHNEVFQMQIETFVSCKI